MTKEEFALEQLIWVSKWQASLLALLFEHVAETPAFEADFEKFRLRMAADIPKHWPKNEPEVGSALITDLVRDAKSRDPRS